MPLVVSSLTGDASDVFDWILSLNHGEPQDLTTLLQMLREHYCGSLTFREQRNTIENLHQKSNEAAIDFLIRVGTSVSNLAKDWKDELTEGELQALQYKVSLNGVKEEIRHVLDSEMAKRDGHLMPQQMYEAIKRYLCGPEQEAGRKRYKYLDWSTEDYGPVLRLQALVSQDNSIRCHRW